MLKRIVRKLENIMSSRKIEPVQIVTTKEKLLSGKTALITGGSGGIGYGIAKRYVESGCKVILIGTNEKRLIDSCEKLGTDTAKYIVLNLKNVSEFHDKIIQATKLFGEERQIDILVNSAGVHGSQPFSQVTEETYDSVMDVNLKGMFFMSQEISNYMKEHKIQGNILNISSASALKPAWTPYEISKWGVKGFTVGLASELISYGIVVNAIAPGPVATKMLNRSDEDNLYWNANPSKRLATTEEIGNLAVYMVSGMGRLIVGDTFYITGGSGTICMDK